MQLALLGRPEIRLNGDLLAVSIPAKGLALLAYLAVTAQPCSRESLAALLWGETPDAAARASLRVTLNRMPAQLRPFLTLTHHTISLNPDLVSLDVAALQTAVTQPPAAWQTAVSLYRSDFLDGLTVPDAPAFEEWALLQRERLRLLVIDLLHRLAEEAEQRQAYDDGIGYTRRSLALDNWREEAHRLLMRLLALNGRRSDALAQFERCRRLLAENLGVEPTIETVDLYEAIKHSQIVPMDTAESKRVSVHNLPASATSFVGRETELTQLDALLAQADGRLLTILGPGGVGKTRLALETAGRHLTDPQFPDGLYFVPLADLPPETAVAAIIAETIGLKLSGADTPRQQLCQHLRQQRLLLILDNFEHLLPQADLLSDLLDAAPGLRLIVTSRERLALYQEWLVEIDGLDLPPGNAPDWAAFSAPQLFIQRARRVFLGFDDAAERESILHICRLVSGLPLALELAAAWVRTIPCQDIARAIERHLDFLASDWRNTPLRQRTLRATFDYSWGLLSEAEQGVLARLAVFHGGFDSAAATAVTGAGQRSLSVLVDKSLVQRQPNGRYQLHEAIRLFAQEKASADDWAAVWAAHARYYADFLAAQGKTFSGPAAESGLRLMALEMENGRFAWTWALQQRAHKQYPQAAAVSVMMTLLPHLSLFYLRRGRSLEAAAWLTGTVQQLEPATAPPEQHLLAHLHHQLAKQEEALGRYAEAKVRLLAALPVLAEAAQPVYEADAWEILGRVQRHLGELAAAAASFERSLALYRLVDQPSSLAGVLNSLGVLAKNNGRYAEATAYYTESLNIFRRQEDMSGVAVCLINLGNIANVQGEYERARACYQESYELAAAVDNRSQMAITLLNLGSVARVTGDVAVAEQQYQASLALGREMGRELIVAAALDGLGQTRLLAGDLAAARELLREGLETAVSLNSANMILTVLASAGRAWVQTGQPGGERLLALVYQQPGAAHHVKEEVAAFTASLGIDLTLPAAPPFTITDGINWALNWL